MTEGCIEPNSSSLLVFPAASRPNINNLISLLPNKRPGSTVTRIRREFRTISVQVKVIAYRGLWRDLHPLIEKRERREEEGVGVVVVAQMVKGPKRNSGPGSVHGPKIGTPDSARRHSSLTGLSGRPTFHWPVQGESRTFTYHLRYGDEEYQEKCTSLLERCRAFDDDKYPLVDVQCPIAEMCQRQKLSYLV